MWLSMGKYLIVLIAASVLSSAQTASVVKVHVSDFKTNRPVKHHRIGLLLQSAAHADWTHDIVNKRTGSDGTAIFELSSLPGEMSVVENRMEVTFSASEVLRHGT